MPNSDIQAELPLTPLSFHILLALSDQPRHGYGVLKQIAQQTEGLLRPATGAIYIAAKRLLDSGLIAEADGPTDPDDDQRRRYYRLTDFGRGVMTAEALRLQRAVTTAIEKGVLNAPTKGRVG